MLFKTGKYRSPLKAKSLRVPGQSVDEARLALVERMFELPAIASIVFLIVALLEWMDRFLNIPPKPEIWTVAALGSLGFTVWRFVRMRPLVKALRQAHEGERAVGQFLERLRERGYTVFHDLIGSGFNVDHVLIGPAGVFTIETKTWSKPVRGNPTITFDGQELRCGANTPDRDPVIQALAQSSWMRELLRESTGKTFHVWPVVLFPGWFIEDAGATSRRLWVLEPKALPGFLDREPHRASAEDVKLASFHLSRFIRSHEAVKK